MTFKKRKKFSWFVVSAGVFSFLLLSMTMKAQWDTTAPKEIKEFDNLCWKDIRGFDLSREIMATLSFNQKTIWKKTSESIAQSLLKQGMNPGLGVKSLHEQGITGEGVTVAIIDQPMYLDHPEFEGKIVAYKNFAPQSESSMHGPAVTSLLVGENIGTAPGARVYYAGTPSWLRDTSFEVNALDWIVAENAKLPKERKIRPLYSVSLIN